MPISWSTTSDWDNLDSSTFVESPSDKLLLSLSKDGFERHADGDTITPPYYSSNSEADTTRAYNGNVSALLIDHGLANPVFDDSVTTLEHIYYETSNAQDYDISYFNENGNIICRVGSNNPGVNYDDSNGTTELVGSGTIDPDYGEWRRITVTMDYGNNQFDILWEDLTGNTSNQSANGLPMVNNSSKVTKWASTGNAGWSTGSDGPNSAVWLDEVDAAYISDGQAITSEKIL